MSRGLGTLFLAAAAVAALASALVAGPARAQQEGNPETTPNQGSYQGSLEMQERERHQQEQIQEQQRQSQQQQNQLYDDALRNAQQQQATPRAPAAQGRSAHAPPAPNWAALPRLPAAKNPLLGGWRPAHAPRTGLLGIPIDPDCDTIEFTATTETAS